MSKIDPDTVTKIARLSRLDITDDKKDQLAKELSGIVDWVEQLSEVNTDDVAPMASVVSAKLQWRDDTVNDGDKQKDVLANAPRSEYGFFAVPKVIE